MGAEEYAVMNQLYRFRNGVEHAVEITDELIKLKRAEHGHDGKAIEEVAIESGVPFTVVRSLKHPSRRPKTIDFDIVERLRGAWLRHLWRQAERIQNDIQRAESFGAGPHHIRNLRAAARKLVERIDALDHRAPDDDAGR